MSTEHEALRELTTGTERLAAKYPSKQLADAYARMSDSYRAEAAEHDQPVASMTSAVAYATARMPATLAALTAVFLRTDQAQRDFQPRTLLDLGSGPGTAVWAATSVWDSLTEVLAVERGPEMRRVAASLASAASNAALREAKWEAGDLRHWTSPRQYDLVVASYVLGELAAPARLEVVKNAWNQARSTLILVEPGTRGGYQRILEAREVLLAAGARIVAPCTHSSACPMVDGDWCHFAARVNRSRLHRSVKDGRLGHEDEPYSYLAVTKGVPHPDEYRIVRRPQRHSGHVGLTICGDSGLDRLTVTRSSADWTKVRKAEWGDSLTLSPVTDRKAPGVDRTG